MKNTVFALFEGHIDRRHEKDYATKKYGIFRRYRPRKNNEKKRYFP